jgi:hypothetical protein
LTVVDEVDENMSLTDVELRRERWRRYRRGFRLDDPESPAFGLGGLARRVRDPRYRLLVLPDDPEANRITFDGVFWEFWMRNHTPPFDAKLNWGHEKTPTLRAALRGETRDGQWTRLIAAHRHGGLEVIAPHAWDGPRGRVFQLIPMVAVTGGALRIQQELVETYSLPGPWEVTLSLRGTEQAHLGGLGEGWLEPMGGGWDSPTCFEPNIRVSLEFDSADWDPEATAFELAAQIEDAWGFQQRRYLARVGDLKGQFDTRRL